MSGASLGAGVWKSSDDSRVRPSLHLFNNQSDDDTGSTKRQRTKYHDDNLDDETTGDEVYSCDEYSFVGCPNSTLVR